jgi:hypothetical protein
LQLGDRGALQLRELSHQSQAKPDASAAGRRGRASAQVSDARTYGQRRERSAASTLASVVTSFNASGWVVPPTVRNPRWLIDTDRLTLRTPTDGYREVSFFDENGLQLVPGTRTSISEPLALHVPEKVGSVEWEALSVQGLFPKSGRGRIDLVAAAKEQLAAQGATIKGA